ncbi:MAG: FAD-dependent oxidoreductase [Gammaproteobacteria bacterium]|nr:FAD-dependent oxidoreductase [Gammaproteobacteria bacterium]MBU0788358.1 FAD-dependent oxidoreductase [Gammaproteobacteria bacterium]MBU0815145.1 FAD-dependent oxidoreductase [Gammaproteobacteria bacterium]MBU1785747.1 FAD-dependent oxidoreductase [Gammaproteobacteria bacterium]
MLSTYRYPNFPYVRPPEQSGSTPQRYPVVVVGAGPVGLAAAIELAQSGVPVVVLDDDDTVSVGSRGVCYAKRTLEILDRIGIGTPCVDKGVSWNVGRTFFRKEEVYNFNLQPQADHKRPGMINLQQYYLEQYEVQRAQALSNLDLRFKSKVIAVDSDGQGATLQVETPDGIYTLETDWLIVADGARSSIRRMMGLEIDGKVFMDRFLIADVVMKADFPTERWFWFDPPFHPGQSVLLHRQADNVFRIDFQLGWQADPEAEKKPENVIPRIKAMLGETHEFDLEWVSVYTFQCRRMNSFTHGRVLFVGDAAHQVSPFGARGANSGIQDTDNLCWKLKLVIEGKAPSSLLDSYSSERVFAADENLLNSTRSTDFITPKSKTSLIFRNAVLTLARDHAFARTLVNSGRLSVPCVLTDSPLNTPDTAMFAGNMVPGASMDDAPMQADGTDCWLLDRMGNRFVALVYVGDPAAVDVATARAFKSLADWPIPVEVVLISPQAGIAPEKLQALVDSRNRFAERYDARSGTTYLIRPDQHVAARWRDFDASALSAALARATANLQ